MKKLKNKKQSSKKIQLLVILIYFNYTSYHLFNLPSIWIFMMMMIVYPISLLEILIKWLSKKFQYQQLHYRVAFLKCLHLNRVSCVLFLLIFYLMFVVVLWERLEKKNRIKINFIVKQLIFSNRDLGKEQMWIN